MNKKIIVVGGIVLLIAIIVGLGLYILINQSNIRYPQAPISVPAVPLIVKPDQVSWIDKVEVPSLKLIKDTYTENDTKYYKIGTFTSGDYKGGDLLLVVVPAEMMGNYTYHFINQSGKLTLVTKNSDQLFDNDWFDRSKFLIDNQVVLSDIIFPEKINYGTNIFSFKGNNLSESFFDLSNSSSSLKVAFVDPKLGNVYMDIYTKENPWKQNGFYIKAPDGTVRTYTLDFDFYDAKLRIPQITWDNGLVNTVEYVSTDRGGCGTRNFASVMYNLSLNDLVAIGKTVKEEPVYELKDKNNLILKNIYTNDYNPYNTPKLSYDEYIQSKPAFFWFDPMGRLIKFQKAEFVPVAECGKPVIYLYPKETTKVSVKVEPKGGLTITEPDYGTGWNVLANPDGKLVELTSGKVYPYLFWEGSGGIYTTPEKGFVIAAVDVHTFLIEKLTKLGLNQKEQADFMEFWEPRMTGAPYFFVTFIGNKGMDDIAPLTITPKPDTVIRILMDFVPLEEPRLVQGYNIKTPERKGFTVVEWGGVLR
jgi:hypothetical protein